MRKLTTLLLMLICFFSADFSALAQKSNPNLFGGLKFRNIGPAMTSGRIADIDRKSVV